MAGAASTAENIRGRFKGTDQVRRPDNGDPSDELYQSAEQLFREGETSRLIIKDIKQRMWIRSISVTGFIALFGRAAWESICGDGIVGGDLYEFLSYASPYIGNAD